MIDINQAYAKWQSGPVTPRSTFEHFVAGWNAAHAKLVPLAADSASDLKKLERALEDRGIPLDK